MGHNIDAKLLIPLLIMWWLLSPLNDKLDNLRDNRVSLLLIVGLNVLFVISVLYSENTEIATGRVERSLPLIALPIILFSLDSSIINVKKIFYALGVGLFITMVVSWFSIANDIMSKPSPLRQMKYFFEWIYTDDNLLFKMDIHPGYFVLFLVLFLTALMNDEIFVQFRKNNWCYILVLFLGILFLVETSSRMGFLSLIIILIVGSFKNVSSKSKSLRLGLIVGLLVFASQFDYLQRKFNMIIDLEGNIKLERYYRWKEILGVFSEENHWMFGVGNGDTEGIYHLAYERSGFTLALKESYNAHNQYLEFLVGTGLIGLLYYLTVLGNFIYRTRLKGMALAFIILITLFSFSESFLIRSKGVFFFSFFYPLFIIQYTRKNEGIAS